MAKIGCKLFSSRTFVLKDGGSIRKDKVIKSLKTALPINFHAG